MIQKTRKLDMERVIGMYEMAVIPRAMFSNDGSLLTPNNKSSFIHVIESQPTPFVTDSVEDAAPLDSSNTWIDNIQLPEDCVRVAIIDAMAVVQEIKKTPQMKKMSDLRTVFCKKIDRRSKGYTEVRVIFDQYLLNSLKEKTRAKRASNLQSALLNYHVNENMTLASVSMKDLLSSSQTKQSLTEFLADGLLASFSGSLIVVHGTQARGKNCDVSPSVSTHSHEEADTLIPLHVIDSLSSCTMIEIDVFCADTDVLVLLMDLVANGYHGPMTKLNFVKSGKKGSSGKDVMVCRKPGVR